MTRPTASELERRLADLEDGTDDDGRECFVVTIGGDPDAPRGWMSAETYAEEYGGDEEDDGTLTVRTSEWSA